MDINHSIKPGDLILYPSSSNRYQLVPAIFLGYRDNPADAEELQRAKRFNREPRGWLAEEGKPRQIADIFYKGRFETCLAHNLQKISES